MKPIKPSNHKSLLDPKLSNMLNPNNELFILSHKIPWNEFERIFGGLFSKQKSTSGKPVRLIIGMLVIGKLYEISDSEVVAKLVQNPYWQYFCGYDYLQWSLSIEPLWLSKWRKRLGEEGMKRIFAVEALVLEIKTVKKSNKRKNIL